MPESVYAWQKFELGLITIQFDSPFLVGGGDDDLLFDSVFVTDANGLPCIPGTTLAGILRHALAGSGGVTEGDCRKAFGYQASDEGEASRVRFSFAHVHSASDQPVPFRGAKYDKILSFLAAGAARDHVWLGMNGAADERAKFDELIVPAGARFTFELTVSHLSPFRLAPLVAVLDRAEVRLGRGTRRGLGRFRVVRARVAQFDLTRAEDLELLGQLPVALDQASGKDVLKELTLPGTTENQSWTCGKLSLKPLGTWMVGGGIPTGQEPERDDERNWDRLPLTERRIQWTGAQGKPQTGEIGEDSFVLPASSIKGALRHRTAFHARRLAGIYRTDASQPWPELTPEECELFGEVRGSDSGKPGHVHFSDVYLSRAQVPYEPFQHVSLDRFTQGPMDHLLYNEVSLGATTLEVDVAVHLASGLSTRARQAFKAALDDLLNGRLSLGSGRGHGRFLGAVNWESNWLEEHSDVAVG